MREPRKWDEEYLLSLPLGEHGWVEAKGRRTVDLTLPGVVESKAREDISKAVSAFANSGGGVLVLGMKELPHGWAIDDGGVALSVKGKSPTREWLEDVIPNLVENPLVDFDVYVVTGGTEGSQIAEGRGVFIVEIGDSEHAPHQALDNRYYIRVGSKSKPIGHRLVTDIFNRRRHPKMAVEVEFRIVRRWEKVNMLLASNMYYNRKEEIVIEADFQASNVGKVYAKYMNCLVYFPSWLVTDDNFDEEVIDGKKYRMNVEVNTRRDYIGSRDLRPEYGPSWFDPILPGLTHSWVWNLGDWNNDNLLESQGDDLIYWEVFADNAPVEKGAIRVRDIITTRTDEIDKPSNE